MEQLAPVLMLRNIAGLRAAFPAVKASDWVTFSGKSLSLVILMHASGRSRGRRRAANHRECRQPGLQ